MHRYAENTEVPIDRSKGEIEKILSRYGASEFAYRTNARMAAIAFRAHDRNIRFILPMPEVGEVSKTPTGRPRRDKVKDGLLVQETRRRWRSLSLSIKAKLDAVTSGIAEFEDEFMPYIVMPGGKTVAEMARPLIEEAYKTGKVGKFLTVLE